MTNYTLKRSNRKTLGLYIRNGNLEVRAPLKCPQSEIDRFVASKQKWIADKLAISREQETSKRTFMLDYGNEIYFCGTLYPIVARTGTKAGFDGKCFYMPSGLSPVQIKDVCIKIYRHLAKIHITNVMAIFAPQMGVAPFAIKINNARTRWGSCSSKKNLNFSWRLIMAGNDAIEYVVVHELAHLLQMNHSAKFWAIVESVLPDYRQRQTRLKALQKRLAAEDWDLK